MFLEGFGVPALIAVEQDHSGNAKNIALALAKGLGATKAGVIETSFREEATSDLFGEQAVLCGGVTALIEAGFDTLVKAGYQPEIAYFECLHELKLIVDLIQKGGMMHMWTSVSNTAEYGGLSRRDRLITAETRKEMAKMLKEIQEGKFAKEWMKDAKSGMKKIQKMEDEEAGSKIEVVGQGDPFPIRDPGAKEDGKAQGQETRCEETGSQEGQRSRRRPSQRPRKRWPSQNRRSPLRRNRQPRSQRSRRSDA